MSIALRREIGLESIQLAAVGALDAQGKPTYAAAVSLLARVERSDSIVRLATGDETKAFATVWVDGQASVLPNTNDKITLADGLVGIVIERKAPRYLRSNVISHVSVKLRRV